jgi:hypothetical protein
MDFRRSLIAAAALTGVSFGTAYADGLRPIEAQAIDLEGVSGIAYYTVERDGFRVVTTLAQGEAGTPVRFEAVLAPGQRVVLSTPREAGVPANVVELRREDDRVLVHQAPVTN